MSLYESLEAFAGAGLISLAPAAGCSLPGGAALHGSAFSAFLRSRGDGGAVGELLDRLAHEVWLAQDARGIPMHVAEAHARRLPAVLDRCAPDPRALAAAIAAGRTAAAPAGLASAVIAAASREGLLERAGLSLPVASFLLERFYADVLSRPGLIESLLPALPLFLEQLGSHAGERSPPPSAVASRSRWPESGQDASAGPESGRQPPAPEAARAALVPAAAAGGRLASWGPRSGLLSAGIDTGAQWLEQTCADLTRPSNDGPELRRLKAHAAEALRRGAFEEAMAALQQVLRILRQQRRSIERRLEDELEALREQRDQEMRATIDLAELAMARLDFTSAAALFLEAMDGLDAADDEHRLALLLRRGDALSRSGERAGSSGPLREAVEVYSSAAQLAASRGDALAGAAAAQGLGSTLLALADHEPSAAVLEQAVAAFRAALPGLSRERHAGRWCMAHIGLGNALASLCETGGASAEMLAQAAGAYRSALEVLTRQADPLGRAVIELNLAIVLIRLGEISDRRANWHDAAAALLPALEVFEAHGEERHAEQARRSLALLHRQWKRLDAPDAAE